MTVNVTGSSETYVHIYQTAGFHLPRDLYSRVLL